MDANDVELCRVYGQLTREYLGDRMWIECEPQLRAGWLRVRRNPALAWEDVAPLVKTFWELAPTTSDVV